jgi:hypothetical protein
MNRQVPFVFEEVRVGLQINYQIPFVFEEVPLQINY